MAESNATQVILTDDGIRIIKAQNTADNATSGVTNLNDPALMSVIEKQTAISQYAGLTSQYKVVLARAKDAYVSTTALTTAYTNLNTFMTTILTDTTKASDVDRDTYKSLTDAYNSALSKVQKNLDDYVNNEFSTASSQAVVADSNATAAKEAADSTYAYANSEIAVQSNATAKAQSKADSAFNQAQTAIDNNQTTNAEITKLRNGSTMTIADLENGLATKVANSEYASYKIQTASQIAQKVDNGAFSAYKSTTADLIASKVATKDFTAYQATTAKSIESKVESKDFNTYKTQTADAITSKVANSDFSTYKTQTTKDINLRVTKDDLIDQINIQAGKTLISSSGQLTLAANTIYFDTKKPVIIPSANIDSLLVGKKLTAANISANTFSTNNETFTVDKDGTITAKNMTLTGGTLTSPTINASTINGSTINGTTFNAGSKLNQYGNTSYPLTINQDGSVTSTSFGNIANDPAALRTVVKDGTVKTNFRGMKQLSTGIYPVADISMGAGQLALLEGYSTSQDPNFTATGLKTTGYAILDASAGLSLHGTTQAINFSGADQSQTTGITMDSYGNLYGQNNSAYWRIGDVDRKRVADFGLDKKSGHQIIFSRNTSIGNLFLGVGHTIGMLDKKPLYFKRGDSRGNMLDIKAGAVHYTSLVKSSLLSVKKDVKRVDTAYWSQLVNSIDLATYQYKSDDNTSHIRLSSIVDDVNDTKQWRLPDVFISRDENGKLTGVDDSVLLNATLATVQEQQKEIDQLNGHNMELEARLNKLEAKLNG